MNLRQAPATIIFSLLVLLALAARRPDTILVPQFWAEDGAVFFLDALRCGAPAFLYQYSGYLHLYPRLGAYVGSFLPYAYAPTFYLLAAMLPIVLVCSRIASRRLVVPDWARIAMLIPLALPPTPPEIMLILTNCHWYFLLLFPLLLASKEPGTWKEAVGDGALLALAAGSSPAALTLMPVLIARAVLTGASRLTLMSLVPAAAVTGVQLLTLVISGRLGVKGPPGDLALLTVQAAASSVAGSRMAASLDHVSPVLVLVCAAAALAALALIVWRKGQRTASLFAMTALLLWTTTVLAARQHPTGIMAGRYHFGPIVLTVWAVILLQRAWMWGLIVALSIPLARWSDWRVPPAPDYSWRTASACLEHSARCRIPIPPEGWFIDTADRVGKQQLTCGHRD